MSSLHHAIGTSNAINLPKAIECLTVTSMLCQPVSPLLILPITSSSSILLPLPFCRSNTCSCGCSIQTLTSTGIVPVHIIRVKAVRAIESIVLKNGIPGDLILNSRASHLLVERWRAMSTVEVGQFILVILNFAAIVFRQKFVKCERQVGRCFLCPFLPR